MEGMFDFSSFLNREAIITDAGMRMSYRQLQDEANRIKDHLQNRKLAFCLCTNTIASVVGYVARIQQGVATVLLDAKKDESLLLQYLGLYNPNYVWSPSNRVFGKQLYEYNGYTLYEHSTKEINLHADLSLLLTTSGSTGSMYRISWTERGITIPSWRRCRCSSTRSRIMMMKRMNTVISGTTDTGRPGCGEAS